MLGSAIATNTAGHREARRRFDGGMAEVSQQGVVCPLVALLRTFLQRFTA
jgi:hypothetical protein